jgi:copper chaperone NosL
MSRTSTVMTWIAVVLFLGAYVFPLWSINLDAPQYPEGMGMKIWISKVAGAKPHDLQNINGLNHYIGMREIHSESIPELRFMKYIVAVLIALGALAAIIRRRWALVVWVTISIIIAIVGISDFYRWAYDYGHNLNPEAAIKVPGMTYTPPIFGSKKLLNITASSYPALGGIMLMLAMGLGFAAAVMETLGMRHLARRKKATEDARIASAVALLILLAVPLGSCTVKESPIQFGTDTCDHCRMTIADEQFGAEIVTSKGRVFKYDAVECMASALLTGDVDEKSVELLLTIDHANPTVLVDATAAVYLRSPQLRSPMGMNLSSFSSGEDAEKTAERYAGETLTWDETRKLVDEARQRAHR